MKLSSVVVRRFKVLIHTGEARHTTIRAIHTLAYPGRRHTGPEAVEGTVQRL